MFKQNRMTAAVAGVLGTGLLAGLSGPAALAQGPEMLEEVVVTGSRIVRDQFESSSPISVYQSDDILKSGASSLDEFLQITPEFAGYALGTGTNNGNNGVKMVDLRGLGHKRTLVLINGRRQVGSFVGGSLDLGAVDLNTIPMGMVERVEVLKDGASTAYGSDAIGGVVNVILRDRFDGVQITGGMGTSDESDGDTNDVQFLMGASSDKGGIVFGLEYHDQKEVLAQERDFSEFATWPVRNADGKFETTNQGSANSRRITVNADTLAQIQAADPSVTGSTFIVDAETGETRPFNSLTDTYNYSAVNALMTPNERWQMSANGDHEIFQNDTLGFVSAYGELTYTKRTSAQRLAPDASFSVTDFEGNPNEFVPASNPFNPFGDNPDNPYGVSGQGVQINRRFVESGGRLFSQNVDTFRFVVGLEGELPFGMGWDVSYVFADNSEIYETQFYHRFDRWATAVDPDACAADAGCAEVGVLNPFGDFGSITPEQMTYLSATSLKDQYDTRMESLQFNFNGDFGDFGSGPISWAAGAEFRTEDAAIKPDEFSASGLTTGGAIDPLKGGQSVDEYYAELLIPILSNLPLVESLDVEAAIRYSDYDTSAEDTTNYRLGVDWALNDSFRVRSVWSTGFRAPNLVEYFTQAVTFPITENWCEFTDLRGDITENIRNNCAALGYDGLYEQGFQYQSTLSQSAAAENLGPEESENFTLGLVFTPESFQNLRLSLDYYKIEIDDYIELPDINFMAYSCLDSEGFSAPACGVFFSAYGGPDETAIDIADIGINQDASTPLENLGTLTTEGIDFAADYFWDINFLGANTFNVTLAGSYLDTFEKDFGALGVIEYAGTAGGNYGVSVYPEWSINANLGLEGANWSVDWRMRWLDESEDLYRPANITDDGVAEDVLYHDLVASYTISNFDLTVGVDNLTDEEPPQFHSGFEYHTAPGVYDTLGRRYWFKITANF